MARVVNLELPLTVKYKNILLIISGGIAAYKSLETIRRLRERGAHVRAILTKGGAEFVTPLSVSTLVGERVFMELFSLTDEAEIGHIRLAKECDLILIAPATADLMAKMAGGIADDLATAVLLASEQPVMIAPAMNTRMWNNAATQRNLARLEDDGVMRVGPNAGALAEGEVGQGRMAEPDEIVAAVANFFDAGKPLAGIDALITSGPTFEPIDPVRFIGNRSSGKQGHAIAEACAALGAGVTLISGPTALADPKHVATRHVETAAEMLAACEAALPVDVAICAAAVSDWRVAQPAEQKIKKPAERNISAPRFELTENPDILARLAMPGPNRPRLVIGFAAETENVIENAALKLAAKGCDWIVANNVAPERGTFGGDANTVHLLSAGAPGEAPHVDAWPPASKTAVAARLASRIAQAIGKQA